MDKNLMCNHFLVGLIFLTICASGCMEQENPAPHENITVGILLPLNGSISEWGHDCLNGSILAIEEINRQGGIQSHGADSSI